MWLGTVTLLGAGWLAALVTAPPAHTDAVAWGGGVGGLLLAFAIAVAAYYAAVARRARTRLAALRGGADELEAELSTLLDDTLPRVVRAVHDGASAEGALASSPRPANTGLQRLLQAVAHEVAAAERRAATGQALTAAVEDELQRIIEETLPTAVRRIRREKTGADRVLLEASRPANATVDKLLHDVVHGLSAGERMSGATMAACASAAARLQAMVTSMLAELRELQHRYDEQAVFGDLLDLDHRASQMGRLADSIALMSGGRTGRRWTKPIRMESILRGAQGRIADYRRVKLHSTSTAAVAGYAAEGVMHALAELLDNATSFSARNTVVHVYVEDEDAGIVITVEDSGLGMRKRERDRAQRMVSRPPGLDNLPGSRLGLAVVGRLARKHRLRVSFRPSARGGIGVVLMIPRHLLTQPRQDFYDNVPSPLESPRPGTDGFPILTDAAPRPVPATVLPAAALPTEIPAPAPAADPPSWTDTSPRGVPASTPPADASRWDAPTTETQEVPADATSWDIPASAPAAEAEAEPDDDLLPQRRRGETLAASPYPVSGPDLAAPEHAPAPRRDSAARFAAFRQAGRRDDGPKDPA
ncbi:sensor histidine kinase [Actinomadura flavalba]|uniref:sensor histidine kinase n=1 Tax=Actinomadura flavalba TaxID=1120938 RepID=UPI00035CD896|nr:ATP-binding protein [Actinomadura flavalba]